MKEFCLDLPKVWTPAEMNTFQDQQFLCGNLLPCVSLPEVPTVCNSVGEKSFSATDKLQKCQLCPKSFSSAEHLRRHMRIHTNEKPYKCQFCYKTFAQVDYLKKHVRTHSSEKPFKCQCCHKVFAQVDHVRRHMRIHTAEKPFKCPLCYKQFALVDYLKKHVRLHAGGKPYSCQCCQKAFAQVDHLRRHLRIHTSEKLFKCQLCCKEFALVDYLKKHSRMHAREKPYKCLCCQKSFSQSDRLKRHIKTHTGWTSSDCDGWWYAVNYEHFHMIIKRFAPLLSDFRPNLVYNLHLSFFKHDTFPAAWRINNPEDCMSLRTFAICLSGDSLHSLISDQSLVLTHITFYTY